MEITVTLNGHIYTVTLTRGPQDTRTHVSICRDGIWAGNGWLINSGEGAGYDIVDCAANMGDDVYQRLVREVDDAFARGEGVEVDPS